MLVTTQRADSGNGLKGPRRCSEGADSEPPGRSKRRRKVKAPHLRGFFSGPGATQAAWIDSPLLRAPHSRAPPLRPEYDEPVNRLQHLTRCTTSLLLGCSALLLSAAHAQEFEPVPELAAATLLPATLVSGENFHIVDPVRGDGLMNRFVLDSHFGAFDAYGEAALAIRVREVAALTQLAGLSGARLVAGGVSGGVKSEVGAAAGVVTNPVATVTGLPRGIAHLFQGYAARGQETLAQAQKGIGSGTGAPGGSASGEFAHGKQAAQDYAARYLGVSAAERGWYKKLGVDPYTDNHVLRAAITRAARLEALGSTGVRFAGLPALPGGALAQRAMDAIYNEDPAVIRARTRKALAGYGLGAAETEAWMNAALLTPTRQVLLLTVADSLRGVAGLGELFRHSQSLTSVAEVQVYLRSAALLARAHAARPLRAIIPGVRLPAAWYPDDSLLVCGAFENVYWTQEVAQASEQLVTSLPPQRAGSRKELWLAGRLSGRAASALRAQGWELREPAAAPAAPGAAP
jgi:hypothetical protein